MIAAEDASAGTPLARKLGIAPRAKIAVLGAPEGFAGRLEGVEVHTRLRGTFDVIVLFCASSAVLERRLHTATRALEGGGGLWIAWPKRASGVPSDLDDRGVRRLGLATGLVDNRVCAIDEVWSALRFVRRRESG
jgi:hypothetical protein